MLGGAVAASRFSWPEGMPQKLGLGLLLVLAWQAMWLSLAEKDWHDAMEQWRAWTHKRTLPLLPYTAPHSPASRTTAWLETWLSWWQEWLLPRERHSLYLAGLGLVAGLMLGSALGDYALALTLGVSLFAQGTMLAAQGRGAPALASSVARIGLPFLLGFGLVSFPTPAIAALAFGMSAAFAGAVHSAALWRNLGYAVTLLALILTRQPIGAFGLCLIWLPQLVLSSLRHPLRWFAAALVVVVLTLAA